ncbi:hypothetical protein P9G84_13725 [Brevibacillus centrosporus]|uniref:hypothetical protein n=1 Tax=Brevibacillus centrosporus TaxID=54910 RepID=UPI00114303D7|nr:hypothetical protein [Brevibacillus centrosporus]MEC2130002.1 hypothetical protein [Brevibacillus centrosporus]GED32380.1 hypothetical protein BCE02nite_35210 [Brevibacillus centrosporus]
MNPFFPILIVVLLLISITSQDIAAKEVNVKGYYRKDGTYVRPHTRSSPGSNTSGGGYFVGGNSNSVVAVNSDLYMNMIGAIYVDSYYRSDGTYVPGHYRTSPDDDRCNNWSASGNINPYTGERGTKDCEGDIYPMVSSTSSSTVSPIVPIRIYNPRTNTFNRVFFNQKLGLFDRYPEPTSTEFVSDPGMTDVEQYNQSGYESGFPGYRTSSFSIVSYTIVQDKVNNIEYDTSTKMATMKGQSVEIPIETLQTLNKLLDSYKSITHP